MMKEEPEIPPEMLGLIRWQEENPDVWGDQDEYGIDLARLRENLKLTPAERLRRNDLALVFAQQVEKAGEGFRETRRGNTLPEGSGD